MKTCPNLPPHERDTRLLVRYLAAALFLYFVIAFVIAHLEN